MNELLTKKAFESIKNGNYASAINIYKNLSEQIGKEFFEANIIYCKKRLIKEDPSYIDEGKKQLGKILIFTNLSLQTIDGSTVFIANTINLFCSLASEVHLLCTVLPGDNFRARVDANKNLSIFHVENDLVKIKIQEMDFDYNYEKIFVRAFGDKFIWFDNLYAKKVILYWTLSPELNNGDVEYYKEVDAIAFQTEELRDYTFAKIGEKRNFLLPPLLQPSEYKISDSSNLKKEGKAIVSYVGTLRSECYSIELLKVIIDILEKRTDFIFYLLISKIYYKNNDSRIELLYLLEQLKKYKNVVIEHQASPDRCDLVLAQSDVGFSLWSPAPENIRQISTKLLENLNNGVKTICFKTHLYENLLGDDYEFFIENPSDLYSAINCAISDSLSNSKKIKNNYLLSNFGINAHRCRLLSYFKGVNRAQDDADCQLFNEQFDKIYGLYINDRELRRLEYLREKSGINISFFHGVDGRETLENAYQDYLKTPFLTEWEKRAQKKRLTIGAMGHLHSFIKIAEDAIEKSYKKILILEADVQIHKNACLLNSLYRPQNFKVMYYGAGMWDKNIKHISEHFYTPHGTTGTFAIALDSSVLKECIAEWKKFVEPTDIALQKITNKYLDQSFVFVPNLFIADVSRSSTTTHRSQKHLSDKFCWNLNDYHVGSVEAVNRYVKKIHISVDYKLGNGVINIIKNKDGDCISFTINEFDLVIDIYDYVKEIEYIGLFLKDIEFIDL